MRRPFLIALLALGTVGGYASGFASLGRNRSCHWQSRQAAYEERLARACASAALETQARLTPAQAPAAAPAPAQAPVQIAPVVVVPPIQMVTPTVAPAPAQIPLPAAAPPATPAGATPSR